MATTTVPELAYPVEAGTRLRLWYSGGPYVDRGTFEDVLDARPGVDVDSVLVVSGMVAAEVTMTRSTDRLGSLIFPTTLSGPDLVHELVRVERLGERSAFSTAWRASWDNIQEGLETIRDESVIPVARVAESARAPLAVSGLLVALLGLLVLAVWAQVLIGRR